MSAPLFSAGRGGAKMKVDSSTPYDPKITDEVDRKIRHMRVVLQRSRSDATKLQQSAGASNFDVIESVNPDNQRPRFYVAPSTALGIHQELSQAVLFKAAMAMGR